MMRGSDGERGKEGIFKPHCFFSFRRCVRLCICVCVIRVPSLSSSEVTESRLQFPLVVIAMTFIVRSNKKLKAITARSGLPLAKLIR